MAVRSVRDLLDQPVLSPSDVLLGEVTDAFLEPTEQRVVKLSVDWVSNRDQVSGPDLDLPLNQVANYDPHQIVVGSEIGETAGLDFDPYESQDLVAASSLLEREVSTRSGNPLGRLADIYFDDADGAVTGYEVEQPEAALPSRILAPSADIEFGADRVVVPDNFHLAERDPFDEEEEGQTEEQDTVFESGEHDRRTEDPGIELPEEVSDTASFLD